MTRGEGYVPVSVFCDIDGTLVDTTYMHTYAWWRALDDAYQQVPMARIHPFVGMGSSELLTSLLGGDDPAITRAHGRYFAAFHDFIRPLPGASEFIRRLAAEGARVVIVTSAKERDLPALLRPLACDDVIAGIVHGEMAGRSKPAPDLLSIALERSGSEPDRSLALGDAVWDVEAATKAGIACVAVESGGTAAARLKEAGALAIYPGCSEILESFATTPIAAVLGGEEASGQTAGAQKGQTQERLVS